MNVLDYLMLAIVAASGFMSLRVGLVREAFALGALLVGLLAAVVLGRIYGAEMPDLVHNPVATQVLFFLLCFLIFYVLVTLIGALVARIVKTMQMRFIDHLLGFAFGCVRGAIVVVLVLAGLTLVLPTLLPKHPEILSGSLVYRAADWPLRGVARVMPDRAGEALRERHDAYLGERRAPVEHEVPVGDSDLPLSL